MILLTKLNKDVFYINPWQIQMIELIPEAKIVMMNHEFFIVRESAEQVLQKIIVFNQNCFNGAPVPVVNRRDED